jgi:hypothetical protein
METLWENLQFWKKKVLKENTDYRFIDFDNTDITGIEILKGDFAGVVYHYGKARVQEEGEFARLQFGYTLVNPGKHDNDELQNNEEFVNMMGDILTQILLKQTNESTRTLNIEEPDIQ